MYKADTSWEGPSKKVVILRIAAGYLDQRELLKTRRWNSSTRVGSVRVRVSARVSVRVRVRVNVRGRSRVSVSVRVRVSVRDRVSTCV